MSSLGSESVLYDSDGSPLAVDNGVATPSDTPLLMIGGFDGTNSRYITIDSSGRQIVAGAGTAGTPAGGVITIQGDPSGVPIPISGNITASNASVGTNDAAIPGFSTLIAGSDGTNLRSLRVFDADTGGGTQWILGVGLRKFAGGGSVELGTSSDPIRVDTTGTTTQPVSGTVTANQGGSWTVSGTGDFTVVQPTASNLRAQLASETSTGTAVPSTAVQMGGSDGVNLRPFFTDSSGRQIVIGAAANGAAATGNPVLVAGSDGTNARTIRTATDGTVRVDPTGTTTQPISGTVTANQGTAAALSGKWPVQVTDGTNTMPTGDVAGRAIFHQITDGTNGPVAVKASTTAPALTDPALVVNLSPNRPATYAASTNGPVSGSTNATATTSIAYIWHTGTNTKRVEIYRIIATSGMETGANHDYSLRGTFITAENGTPGGTTTTPLPFDRGDAASTITSTTGTFRLGATGAPTRLSSDMISEEMYSGNNNQKVLFDIHYTGKPIVLRASQAEGFEIRMVGNGNGNLSQAPEITITMYWMEI
jgi:hypothetical protein